MLRHGMLLAVLLSLSGCVGLGGSGSAEETAHTQLEAIWERDADRLEATFADRFFDFGGGRWIDDPSGDMRSYLASAEAREEMGRFSSWQDLVVLEEAITGHPSDLGEQGRFFQDEGFELGSGDRVWYAPPSEDSPLFDGWGGLYRVIDGEWRMVGGD